MSDAFLDQVSYQVNGTQEMIPVEVLWGKRTTHLDKLNRDKSTGKSLAHSGPAEPVNLSNSHSSFPEIIDRIYIVGN